jgi:hypothetical protein
MDIIRQSDRAFGFTFTVLFALIFMIFNFGFSFDAFWALWVSFGFFLIALLTPSLLLPLNRIWALIAGKISHANNYILLGIFFITIMLPAGLLLRLFSYDPMNMKSDENAETYWVEINRHTDSQTLKDMF